MEKKSKAKAEMLKELSKEMSNDMYSPMKDMIGKKGMKKVSVMSDSPEGLQKGLSMAERLMKLKSNQEGGEEEGEDSEEESCPKCKGKGCPFCQASEESEDSEEESPEMEAEEDASEMSPDEMEAMYEMLKKKLGK
jgi:hypothetical protein